MNTHLPKVTLALMAGFLIANPALAQDFDFSGAESVGNSLLDWARGNLANIILTGALVIAGFLAAFNRIPWSWFFAVLFGAFIIYGAPKLVSWLSGAFT